MFQVRRDYRDHQLSKTSGYPGKKKDLEIGRRPQFVRRNQRWQDLVGGTAIKSSVIDARQMLEYYK